ncbi:uncharacterized protein PAC_19948 [Phialocephala subalpina]|uniref:Uncharacterized protein n=1 Tax=Phialocephala subalpina TaxID=576137 RepID=A0A1L7XYE9_9HELO|nr:uncharacterized protein PAC_19948 [Phialocephala subalpina]
MLSSDTNHPQMFEWDPLWDPISPAQRQLGNVSLDACESFDWNIHYQSPEYSIVSPIERGNGKNEDWVICLARDSVTSSILVSSVSLYPSYAATTTPFIIPDIPSLVSSIAESNTDIFHLTTLTLGALLAALTGAASTGLPIGLTPAALSSTAGSTGLTATVSASPTDPVSSSAPTSTPVAASSVVSSSDSSVSSVSSVVSSDANASTVAIDASSSAPTSTSGITGSASTGVPLSTTTSAATVSSPISSPTTDLGSIISSIFGSTTSSVPVTTTSGSAPISTSVSGSLSTATPTSSGSVIPIFTPTSVSIAGTITSVPPTSSDTGVSTVVPPTGNSTIASVTTPPTTLPTSVTVSPTSSATDISVSASVNSTAVVSPTSSGTVSLTAASGTRSPPTFTESFTATSSSAHSKTWVGVLHSILPSGSFTDIPTVTTPASITPSPSTFLTSTTTPTSFPPTTSFSTLAGPLLLPPVVTTTAEEPTSNASILSQVSSSSVTGLSTDGKMSLILALPSLVVAMVGVWIAWSTLVWMKKQQEASVSGGIAPVNVNIHLQLLVT